MSIKELDLIENKETREQVIDRVEVLDKVGDLLLLPNTEYATTEQVATYYGVDKTAIRQILARNGDELENDGIKYLTGKEIKDIYDTSDIRIVKEMGDILINDIKVAYSNNILFSKSAILRIAFYLTESEVAKKVRTEILKIDPELYYNLSNAELLRFKKYEKDMEYFLKALFGDELVKTQVPCGKYKLDFVIDDTIHIEVDEHGHVGYNALYEKQREDYILNYTDYWTFRFNPQSDSKFELIRDIFELYEHIGFPNVKNNIKEECYG